MWPELRYVEASEICNDNLKSNTDFYEYVSYNKFFSVKLKIGI